MAEKKVLKTFSFEATADGIDKQDGGHALICHLAPESNYGPGKDESGDEEMNGLFVRVQSWCEFNHDTPEHPDFDALMHKGHKYRITIEDITQ